MHRVAKSFEAQHSSRALEKGSNVPHCPQKQSSESKGSSSGRIAESGWRGRKKRERERERSRVGMDLAWLGLNLSSL